LKTARWWVSQNNPDRNLASGALGTQDLDPLIQRWRPTGLIWIGLTLLAFALVSPASASLFVALEGDARGTYSESGGADAEVASVGGSLRKVFADRYGDRLILYVQAESAADFSEAWLHQAYAEWKGPMGLWNVAAGRVPLPWGLRTAWSPDRLPYSSPYEWTRTPESDNGVLLRGTADMWDYGLALTQGYGMKGTRDFPGPGNLTGRLGITPGVEGDFTFGLSFATGTAYTHGDGHGMGEAMEEERTAAALDCTWNAGRGTYRFEGGARRDEERWHGTLFGAADYALLPKLTLQAAGQLYEHAASHIFGRVYGGVSIPLPWFTIRGGYEYERAEREKEEHADHRFVVQLYRLLSIVR
jgi:hypothetical protein